MFNFLSGKDNISDDRIFIDKVFIHTKGKIHAILELAKQESNVLFIAWFDETFNFFSEIFTNNNLEENLIVKADQFSLEKLQNHSISFLEHYPLPSKEMEFAEKWNLKNCKVFSSMDEPLFKHFGSEKMLPLIKLFGMKENEPIEHSYVTQSINKGQLKISALVSIERIAKSQEEWMNKNVIIS